MKNLTQEYLKEIFDYKNGNLFWKKRIGARAIIGKKAGCINSSGYLSVKINGKNHLIHRLIFLREMGYLPKFIDHIDGNPINNAIENLREVTLCQNQWNQKFLSSNTSGVKGVSWVERLKKWKVQIQKNNKKYYFGVFSDFSEASEMAKFAIQKLHGSFSRVL